jgi:hypothetical protein
MEVIGSCETLLTTYKTIQYHNTEDHSPHFHCCENWTSHLSFPFSFLTYTTFQEIHDLTFYVVFCHITVLFPCYYGSVPHRMVLCCGLLSILAVLNEGWSEWKLKKIATRTIICTHHQKLLGWSNQGGWDGSAYGTHRGWEICIKFWFESPKGRDQSMHWCESNLY